MDAVIGWATLVRQKGKFINIEATFYYIDLHGHGFKMLSHFPNVHAGDFRFAILRIYALLRVHYAHY